MQKILTTALFTLSILVLQTQPKPPVEDINAIKSMCGCYSITFDYAETFATDPAYERKDPYHAEAMAEWIFAEEETDDKIVIQHLLLVGEGKVIKHWRQDWLYQNTDQHLFTNTRLWKYNQLPRDQVNGQWTQKVYQVADSPRYEGSASWRHIDGEHYWKSTADAPLPRREYTKRHDYNVMQRTNRHILTDDGWLHEQDNLKIIRTENGDSVLVAEKGLNKYSRIDNSHCQTAIDWWEKNAAFWKLVRAEWDRIYDMKQDLRLKLKVEDNILWESLFALGTEMAEASRTDPEKVGQQIRSLIESYMDPDLSTSEAKVSKYSDY